VLFELGSSNVNEPSNTDLFDIVKFDNVGDASNVTNAIPVQFTPSPPYVEYAIESIITVVVFVYVLFDSTLYTYVP